ncbi:minor capsid protein [Capybara microvirus Cap1_SP_106]|nr:minor capsid protein [Capybara microvirus Cap1_SP_106]
MSDLIGFAPSVAGIATSLIGNAFNAYNVKKTNELNAELTRETNAQNMAMFQQQMDYTKGVQQETWNREDTGFQRAVSDAQQAGLSALAVQGGADSGAIASQPSAPQMQSPQMQAFQADVNGIADQFRSLQQALLDDKKMSFDEKQNELNRLNDIEKTQMNIASAEKIEQMREDSASDSQAKQHAHESKQLLKQSDLAIQKLDKEQRHDLNKSIRDSVKNVFGIDYCKEYSNKDEYSKAMESFTSAYVEFLKNTEKYDSFGSSSSDSSQYSGGLSGSKFKGLGLGLNVGVDKGSSSSESYSQSNYNQKLYTAFLQEFGGYPIYIGE